MKNFIPYWNAYKTQSEAHEPLKTSWSDESLSAGILRAAIESLSTMISEATVERFPVIEIHNGVYTLPQPLFYCNIRVSLIGIEKKVLDLPEEFIHEVEDKSRESICLCILPSSEQSLWQLDTLDEHQIRSVGVIPLYPNDIDAIGNAQIQLIELIEYKLFRRLILEKPDSETQFHPRLFQEYRQLLQNGQETCLKPFEEVFSEIREDSRNWIEHPLLQRVCRELKKGRGCLLSGPSSSGKSILAFQVGHNLLLSGEEVKYLNLSTLSSPPKGIVNTFFLSSDRLRSLVVVIDDLQSNPTNTKYILAIASIAQRVCLEYPPVLLTIAWPDYAREATIWHENCLPLAVRPFQIYNRLARKYREILDEDTIDFLVTRLGDDLLLLRLSLEQSKDISGKASLADVASRLWYRRVKTTSVDELETRRIALIAGSLSRYDISVSPAFLKQKANTSDTSISQLLYSRFLRRQWDSLTMGHRSLCGLICDWLETQGAWQELSAKGGPSNTTEVVLDYLRSLGSSLAIDTLRSLHARAGFKPKLNRGAAVIVEIWRAFNSIAERIEQQQAINPTWGNVPSSAMFATQTFYEIGKPSLAQQSLNFLRGHWKIEGDKLRVLTDGLATQGDFQQILLKMKEEDEITDAANLPFWWPATEIDIERFHQTWLTGIILCAEAASENPLLPLHELGQLVEAQQLDSGAFYPERVPWATTRVLLGLAACGHTVDTSPAVRRAVNWLLRDYKEKGAFRNGIWTSGTGTWNTELEATGMVLLALSAVGYDCSDEKVEGARNFLLSSRSEWTSPGRELDGALAIQAYLDTGGEWEDVSHEAQHLSQWARSEAFWQGATRSAQESLNQSCRVAQIASHLINIGWTIVRSNLPAFLDALATPHIFRDELSQMSSERIYQTAILPNAKQEELLVSQDIVLRCLLSLSHISLSECTVTGKYRRFDEKVRNRLKDWQINIVKPLHHKTLTHENFLIWAAPGSGKSFFIQEIASSQGNAIKFIELNLAKQLREPLIDELISIKNTQTPILCLLDEIDAKIEESWPYEEIFPLFDLNLEPDRFNVFVLVGSSQAGLQGLARSMASRNKGKDLLDRIPTDRRFEIPPLTLEDRIVVFVSQIIEAAKVRRVVIREVEKLSLYFALKNEDLQTSRQLRDLAFAAVYRFAGDDNRLKYDNLFLGGDTRNQRFWVDHHHAAERLSSVFVRIED